MLLVDAKYVAVKGYEEKIAFIYGIDYATHDIPICLLAPTENYFAYRNFFVKVRNTGYKLRGIVSDEHEAIQAALQDVYPGLPSQICHTHFLENIRKALKVRTEETYRPFIRDLQWAVFCKEHKKKKHCRRDCIALVQKYAKDKTALAVLLHIERHFDLLTNHLQIGGCPKTSNLIESYNKQLNGRLKTIQGFESFQTAEQWLSCWILRRRLTPFTDCKGKFKKLNGSCSLHKTLKAGMTLPDWF